MFVPPVEGLLILLLALAYDTLFGEPPANLHPVVGMGKIVNLWQRFAPSHNSNLQLLYGLFAVLLSVGGLYAIVWRSLDLLHAVSPLAAIALEAYLLKGCFSVKMLAEVGLKIRRLLSSGKLEEARTEMRSLVSRNVSRLDEQQIMAATIESVAENTTDSFAAPLFFYILLGVPGVLAYRLVNTFDSMIGYRGKYEYLGKAAARLDDILNYIPARLTAFLLIISARLYWGDAANAWRIARRDHNKTASPNAGWTMAAIAGALHVQLEKVGYYKLGDDEKIIVPGLINRAVAALYFIVLEITLLYAFGAAVIFWLYYA